LTSRTGEDAALLRTEGDAGPRDRVGGTIDQLGALEAHGAAAAFDDAHDGLERRRLADAVAAEKGHYFTRQHVEGDAVQHVRFAVPGLEILDREQWLHLRHDRFRDRLAHSWIGGYRRIVALGQHLPASKHGDTVAKIGDNAEIVLDHEYRTLGSNRPDQVR